VWLLERQKAGSLVVQDSKEGGQQKPAVMTSQSFSPRQCLAKGLAMEELAHPCRSTSEVDLFALAIGLAAELFDVF
jgi:hypothetical protein